MLQAESGIYESDKAIDINSIHVITLTKVLQSSLCITNQLRPHIPHTELHSQWRNVQAHRARGVSTNFHHCHEKVSSSQFENIQYPPNIKTQTRYHRNCNQLLSTCNNMLKIYQETVGGGFLCIYYIYIENQPLIRYPFKIHKHMRTEI